MLIHWEGYRQRADRAEVALRPLVSLIVQQLVLELRRTLLARPLVLLAMCLLTVHAAVLDEVAGIAVLELDGIAPVLAAVSAGFDAIIRAGGGRIVHRGGNLRTLPKRWDR